MLARGWHATIAILVVGAIVLQIVIAVRLSGVPHDVSTGFVRGSSVAGRIIRVLSFFAILSNLLSGIVSAQLAMRPDRDGRAWRPLRLAALFGITMTALHLHHRAGRHPSAGRRRGDHGEYDRAYVAPVMMVAGWLLFRPRPRIDRRAIGWSLLFPVLWFACTLVRGAIWKWYPYPFVDVTTQGYPRVVVNALLVTVVLAVVAALFALGDAKLPAVPRAR